MENKIQNAVLKFTQDINKTQESVIRISQGQDTGSHQHTLNNDYFGAGASSEKNNKCYLLAPFDCEVKAWKQSSNQILFQSTCKVKVANKDLKIQDYVCIQPTHMEDADLKDIFNISTLDESKIVGKTFNKGDVIYREGAKGFSDGYHIHMTQALGVFKGSTKTPTYESNDYYEYKDSKGVTHRGKQWKINADNETHVCDVFYAGCPVKHSELSPTANAYVWKSEPTYTISVKSNLIGAGTVGSDCDKAGDSKEIKLTYSVNRGYKFKGWKEKDNKITFNGNKFEMPCADVEIEAIFEKLEQHQVMINNNYVNYVELRATPTLAYEGEQINLYYTITNSKWEFKNWVIDKGNEYTILTGSSFRMPNCDVTIFAELQEKPPKKHKIEIFNDQNFLKITPSKEEAYEGEEITLNYEDYGGLVSAHFYSNIGYITNNKFIMPDEDVWLEAELNDYRNYSPVKITAYPPEGGNPTSNYESVPQGTTVNLEPRPNQGYYLDYWLIPFISGIEGPSPLMKSNNENASFVAGYDIDYSFIEAHYTTTKPKERFNIKTSIMPVGGGRITVNKYEGSEGDLIEVSALKNATYNFVRWESSEVSFSNSTNEKTTFVMPAKEVKISAIFAKKPDKKLIVKCEDTQGVVNIDSNPEISPYSIEIEPLSTMETYTIMKPGTAASIMATSKSGWKFDYWQLNNGQKFYNSKVTLSADDYSGDIVATAYFKDISLYRVYSNIYPVGGGTVSMNKNLAKKGETVEVTASKSSTYNFLRWESSNVSFGNSTSSKTTFTMPAGDVILKAVFEKKPSRVLTIKCENTRGSVNFNGTESEVSPYSLVSNSKTLQPGTIQGIHATAKTGWKFSYWELKVNGSVLYKLYGSSSYLNVDDYNGNIEATAYFTAISYSVEIDQFPAAGGTQTKSHSSATSGTIVTIKAIEKPDFGFIKWTTSDVSLFNSKNALTTFVMPTKNVKVTANYGSKVSSRFVTVKSNSTTMGTVKSSTSLASWGTKITFTATPKAGYKFRKWTFKDDTRTSTSTSSVATFTMNYSPITATAEFYK